MHSIGFFALSVAYITLSLYFQLFEGYHFLWWFYKSVTSHFSEQELSFEVLWKIEILHCFSSNSFLNWDLLECKTKNEQNAVNEVFINFLLAAYTVENFSNRKKVVNCYSRGCAWNYNIEFKWMPIVIMIYLSWTKGHK